MTKTSSIEVRERCSRSAAAFSSVLISSVVRMVSTSVFVLAISGLRLWYCKCTAPGGHWAGIHVELTQRGGSAAEGSAEEDERPTCRSVQAYIAWLKLQIPYGQYGLCRVVSAAHVWSIK